MDSMIYFMAGCVAIAFGIFAGAALYSSALKFKAEMEIRKKELDVERAQIYSARKSNELSAQLAAMQGRLPGDDEPEGDFMSQLGPFIAKIVAENPDLVKKFLGGGGQTANVNG